MKALHDILLESRQYLATAFLDKYSKIFAPEHLQVLSQNLQTYYRNGLPTMRVPKFSLECTPLAEAFGFFEAALTLWAHQAPTVEEKICQAFAEALTTATIKHVLVLLGQRLTPASISDERAIPPTKQQLISSAMIENEENLSVAARAWTKHAHRSPEKFWGEVRGTTAEKNAYVRKLLEHMLEQKTWWNVFGHPKHEAIYEIRLTSGHGARWVTDGRQFIGFVEPFDPVTGKVFERE
jgi:hypothetical protein